MNWNISSKSRTFRLTDDHKAYIEDKIGKLERYIDQIQNVSVVIKSEANRGNSEVVRVEVTLHAEHGVTLRAEEQATDIASAIDTIHDNLQRQITRYKGKYYRRGRVRRANGQIVEPPAGEILPEVSAAGGAQAAPDEESREPLLMRTKTVALKPMFSDEAIEQMEMLGHDFFVFRDAETEEINVVYRRRDGNYGLITPR